MNKKNVDLDKKLQMYIAKTAIPYLPYGSKWDSSAEKLQNELRTRGINLKVYYEYKLPHGIKSSDFMYNLVIEYFINNFYSDFASKVFQDKKLTVSDKLKILKYVFAKRRETKGKMKQYEQEIRKLNPELANVKVNNSQSLVNGAMFGFAPDDIEYFADANKRDMDYEEKLCKMFQEKYGINLTYVLAPKTAKIIIKALEQNIYYNNNAKER